MIVLEAAHEIRIAKKVQRIPQHRRRFALLESWEHVHGHVLLRRPAPCPPCRPSLAAYAYLLESLRLLNALKIAHMAAADHVYETQGRPVLGGLENAVDLKAGKPKTCGSYYPPDARLFCLHSAGHPLLPVLAEICPDPEVFEHYLPIARLADPSLALLKGWRTWDAYALTAAFLEAGVDVPAFRTHFDAALRSGESGGECGAGATCACAPR
jgi:hypothetical protein